MTDTAADGTDAERAVVASIRGLDVRFQTADGEVHAVRGVDLDIRAGEIVALVGESGSGKTVLNGCLLGLPPQSRRTTVTGEVSVLGVDMIAGRPADVRAARRRSIGAVFQDPLTSLDPLMRIGPQVLERGGDEKRALESLDDCGVPEPATRLRQWPHQLSGGLRQRVSIASALTAEQDGASTPAERGFPALLLADEPTTALDVRVQAQIIELFARLRDEHGCAVLLVTHDLGVAAQIADRIAVMNRGELCEVGPAARVLADPQHPYTRRLLESRLDINKPVAHEPSAPAEGTALELRDIVKRYRRPGGRRDDLFTAVDGVSVSVPEQGSVALVGESGCGKSTLLRIAAGLIRPDGGTVTMPADARPQMVFQDAGSSLTPWLTVGQGIRERLRARGASRSESADRCRELLDRVGLEARISDARPRELSGGQRQRAAIARALASDPSVLLCDEPVSALDATLAARVLNLLDEVRRDLGIALVMVTHDLAVARRISDVTAVMVAGAIVESGPTEAIFTDPRHPYTRQLIAASPTIHAVAS